MFRYSVVFVCLLQSVYAGQGCGVLMSEYPLLWCTSKRARILVFSLVLGTTMFGSFAPGLSAWLAMPAITNAEHHLVIGVFIAFSLAMLAFTVYTYYVISIILGWVEGYVRLCKQAAARGPHNITSLAARAVRAYGRLDTAFGPIGFFSVAYGQLICILELYRSISGLVVAQTGAAVEQYGDRHSWAINR